MEKANQDVRQAAKQAGIKLWQIAERFGVLDSNFARLLRKELTTEKKKQIYSIIEELKAENQAGGITNDR